MILVIAEQRDGELNRATWEAVAAAQQLAGGDADQGRRARRVGRRCRAGAGGRRRRRGARRSTDPALEPYTPDGYVLALAQVDRVGVAAGRRAGAHVSDARLRADAGGAAERAARHRRDRRSPGSGRQRDVHAADVPGQAGRRGAAGRATAPCLVTFQIGAFRADAVQKGAAPSPVTNVAVTIDRSRDPPEAGGAVPGGASRPSI